MFGRVELRTAASVTEYSVLVDDSFLCDVDATARKALLEDWRETCVDQLLQMSTLCSKNSWKELENMSHSLKGSSAQVGAMKLSEVAANIEILAHRSGDLKVVDLVSALEDVEKVAALTFVHFGLDSVS